MTTPVDIDVSFDFRQDTPPGKDPDARSPTLRRYHQRLWSKALPAGAVFQLDTITPRVYLHHESDLGKFELSSDTVVPDFGSQPGYQSILGQIPLEERATFVRLTYTIGGMMIFPSNQVDRKMTINAARGCNGKIKDRFDLTVECVRRHYRKEPSPLDKVLARYCKFFNLFETFEAYVDFFLLQDMVTPDYSSVRFALPFDGFSGSPLPASVESYREYCRRAAEFIEARNARIKSIA